MVQKSLQKKFVGLAAAILLSACSSTGYDSNGLVDNSRIIGNADSVEVPDRTLAEHYSVNILKSGVEGSNYVRIVSVSLDDLVVIVARSEAPLKSKTFVNILKNSGSNPLGNSVDDLPHLVKSKPKASNIKIGEINSDTVHDYINDLGYKDSKNIVRRILTFNYQNQTMTTTEYILPTVEDYSKFYLLKTN